MVLKKWLATFNKSIRRARVGDDSDWSQHRGTLPGISTRSTTSYSSSEGSQELSEPWFYSSAHRKQTANQAVDQEFPIDNPFLTEDFEAIIDGGSILRVVSSPFAAEGILLTSTTPVTKHRISTGESSHDKGVPESPSQFLPSLFSAERVSQSLRTIHSLADFEDDEEAATNEIYPSTNTYHRYFVAWRQARRRTEGMSNRRFDVSDGPVDLDSEERMSQSTVLHVVDCVSDAGKSIEVPSLPKQSFNFSFKARHGKTRGTIFDDGATHASIPRSDRTDRTPITSNRRPRQLYSSGRRRSVGNSSQATEGLFVDAGPNDIGEPSEGGGTEVSCIGDNEDSMRRRRRQRDDFCDWRTWQGKACFISTVVLIVAFVLVVVFAAQSSKGESDPSSLSSPGGNDPIVGIPWATSSNPPSPAPNFSHFLTNSPSSYPILIPSHARGSETISPSIVALLTRAPTTSLPSNPPSSKPSSAAVSLHPTEPPSESPTKQQSSSPSVSFQSIEFSGSGDGQPDLAGSSPGDGFGAAIALSSNGKVLVVGAPSFDAVNNIFDGSKTKGGKNAGSDLLRAGRVQIYQRPTTQEKWAIRGKFIVGLNANDNLGSAVATSEDGSVLAISEPTHDGGGPQAGRVSTYRWNATREDYDSIGQISGSQSGAYLGVSVALSWNGDRLVIGAPLANDGPSRMAGEVRVYQYEQTEGWLLLGKPIPGSSTYDWLGSSVDISSDGDVIVASAPRNNVQRGYVRAWSWDGTTMDWVTMGGSGDMINDLPLAYIDDRFGYSISLYSQANISRVAVGIPFRDVDGVPNSGMTVVYDFDSVAKKWGVLGSAIVPGSPSGGQQFGYNVDFVDGSTLAIGSPGWSNRTGSVSLYRYQTSSDLWLENAEAFTGEREGDDFGYAVSVAKPLPGKLCIAAGAVAGGRSDQAGYLISYVQI